MARQTQILTALQVERLNETGIHFDGEGLYLLSWNGETLPLNYAAPGMLQTQAATTSLFARGWRSTRRPPERASDPSGRA